MCALCTSCLIQGEVLFSWPLTSKQQARCCGERRVLRLFASLVGFDVQHRAGMKYFVVGYDQERAGFGC